MNLRGVALGTRGRALFMAVANEKPEGWELRHVCSFVERLTKCGLLCDQALL